MANLPVRVRRAFHVFLPGRSLLDEVDEEIAFHLEERTRALVAEGRPPADAAAEARRRFGDLDTHRRNCRALARRRDRKMRRREGFADLTADLGFAVRQLFAHPGFSLPAVLTLALGIGATTALFSAVYAVAFRPLPYPEPERLVWVWEAFRWGGDEEPSPGSVSAGNFTDWARAQTSFDALAAVQYASFNLAGGGDPERVLGARVTAGYFDVLGLAPQHGRTLAAEEDEPGRERVVVLSDGLWRRRFGADPGVVGRTVRMNGTPHEVVGVMPAAANAADNDEQLWVPMAWTAEREAMHDEHSFLALGRLRPGASAQAAQDELSAISERVRATLSGIEADQVRSAIVHPLLDDLVGDSRQRLLVLLGAVGLVLLIACVNVANLMLARGIARRREMAVRTALGAGSGRLVRQLLTESLVLGLAGGAAGLGLAYAGLPLLLAAAPEGLPRLEQAVIDGTVLAFALGLALASGVAAGLVPAFRSSNVAPEEALRESGAGGAGAVVRRDRLRGVLVASEVAMTVALLIGAGLLLRTGAALSRVDLGFDPTGVMAGRVTLPAAQYPPGEATRVAVVRLLEEVAALPGVTAAAVANQVPLSGGGTSSNGLLPQGRPLAPENLVQSNFHLVSPGYFEALRLPIVRGRALTAADRAGAPRVMVVNQALARSAWPGEDPLGKYVDCCEGPGPDGAMPSKEVVGVVADARFGSLDGDEGPAFYLPLGQEPEAAWTWLQGSMAVLLRTGGDPAALAEPLRRAVARVDPDLPLYAVSTMAENRAGALAAERFNGLLLTLLGALALLLAAVGVYGILAYYVGQRTREIGVRIALGASSGRVFALVLTESLAPVAAGVAVGLGLAAAGARLLESQLFGVTGTDPATFAAVAVLLSAVAAAAAALPARRALAIEPAKALRVG